MSSEPPPNPITSVFNIRDWIRTTTTSSGGLTQAQADELYISKLVDSICYGAPLFVAGFETWKLYAASSTKTATNLTEWTDNNPFGENFNSIGNFYQLNGYSITPVTTTGIKYYPAASTPIQFPGAVYNIQATIVLSATAFTGGGRFSFGVTTNPSATSWLPSSNGGYVGNLTRIHLPTSISAADLPIILSVNFNCEQTGGNLYFIYEIQGTLTTGSLIVNFNATRIGGF